MVLLLCASRGAVFSQIRVHGVCRQPTEYRLIVGARTVRSGRPVGLRYHVHALQIVRIFHHCVALRV